MSLALLIVGLILLFITADDYLRARRKQNKLQKIAENDFICPYCGIQVTKENELDVINHLLCIEKARHKEK